MTKIEVYQTVEDGIVKLGARVNDPEANVADLLEAWQPLCDDESIYKIYGHNHYSACKGCPNNCCDTAYVIPDLISFRNMAAQLQVTEPEFIQDCFDQDKWALGLLKIKSNPCIFAGAALHYISLAFPYMPVLYMQRSYLGHRTAYLYHCLERSSCHSDLCPAAGLPARTCAGWLYQF